jgi:virulence-associated protein VapD
LNESNNEKEKDSLKDLIKFEIETRLNLIGIFKNILKESKEIKIETKIFALECFSIYLKHKEVKDLSEVISILNHTMSIESPSIMIETLKLFKQLILLYDEIRQDDEYLLSDYIVHFISSLSKGFEKASTSYLLFISTCELASIFIPSRMLVGQEKTLSRVCKFIFNYLPFDSKNESFYFNFGDISTCIVKIEILKTLSQCFLSSKGNESGGILLTLIQPYLTDLHQYWKCFLKDYLKLLTRKDELDTFILKKEYQSTFFKDGTQHEIFYFYQQSFEVILESFSCLSSLKEEDVLLVFGLSLKSLYQRMYIQSSLNSLNSIIPLLDSTVHYFHSH